MVQLKSICFVTPDLEPLTSVSGIGTHYSALTKLLVRNGWDVTVLICPQEPISPDKIHNDQNSSPRIYDARVLGDQDKDLKPTLDLQQFASTRSHLAHRALQKLIQEREREFNFIEFPDGGGTGFIPVQMKRNYRAYQGSRIIVKLHGSWAWAESERPALTLSDLKRHYLEQYSVENADILVSSSHYLLDWCRSQGWRIRSDASVCRLNPSGIRPNENQPELTDRNVIVFFGVITETKGVREFIEALRAISRTDKGFPARYSVAFVGKLSAISKEEILDMLDMYEVKFVTFPTREQALTYLHENARLVVIPSRIDNSPNTILECMLTRIPFVTSRSGGITEMLAPRSELYESISCSIEDPRNLPSLIQRHMKFSQEHINRLLDLAYARGRSLINVENILQWYNQHLTETNKPQRHTRHKHKSPEPVTIIMPTKNDREYMETALNALLNQTYKKFKLIINESPSESKHLLDLEKFVKKIPGSKLIRKENFSQGEAMNQALRYVDTKYFMEVHDDNISKPNMIETFLNTMQTRNDVAVLSSYYAKFIDDEETKILDSLKQRDVQFIPSQYFEPIGPCLPVLFFENTQGDANSIYLTEAVRKVGGWPMARHCVNDRALFLKLTGEGYNMDVIPEVLYYYRLHKGNLYKELKNDARSYSALLDVTDSIVQLHPELITRHYRSLHKLVLGSAEPKSALSILNARLAELTAESPKIRDFLEFSGKILRKTLVSKRDT